MDKIVRNSNEDLNLYKLGSNLDFGGQPGCPQSRSTGDNSGLKSHNSEQNTCKMMLREMRTIMGFPAVKIALKTNSQILTEEFLTNFKARHCIRDDSYLIHAKHVLETIETISKEKYGQEDYFQKLLDHKFLTEVLKELERTKSYERRKTILRKLCRFYFDKLNLHKFNIERNRCLNLLNYYGKSGNGIKKPKAKLHPIVDEFIDFLIYSLDQKWERRARLNIMNFLEWLVETNEVEEDNPIEIDVKKIKAKSLVQYRNFLILRMELKQISADTAQMYIRSLRRWFEFLKKKKYISRNPCNQLDNIKVKPKEKGELLPVETVKEFFQVIWEDKDALKWLSIFMILATDGLRSIEVIRLKRSNVYTNRNEIKIIRKGGDVQVLPITGLASLILEFYLKSDPDKPDAFVWKNSIGNSLTYENLKHSFYKFKKEAGIETIGATHFFRRLLMSELAYQTMDLDSIKNLAGHKSLKHLDPYLFVRLAQLKNKVVEQMPTMGVEFCGKWN